MNNEEWLIVDTETDGLCQPIHVVEIAAQRMCGWIPQGDPFRVLLNHDVPIDPAAEAVHGYSREYLRENGIDPIKAHEMFYDYAGRLPIVAYNISFDWDRVLYPEYNRLHIPSSGSKGFCALTLARRTIPEAENYRLETLKLLFRINTGTSHRGRNDVATLVELMTMIIRPRLESAGILGFEQVGAFSRRTPVAHCLDLISKGAEGARVWYILVDDNKESGPYTVPEIKSLIGNQHCFAWRSGMAEWVPSDQLPEFSSLASKLRTKRKPRQKSRPPQEDEQHNATMQSIKLEVAELAGICSGIAADGIISAEEFTLLRNWLAGCRHGNIYPMNILADEVERISGDGFFTSAEHAKLIALIQDTLMAYNDAHRKGVD